MQKEIHLLCILEGLHYFFNGWRYCFTSTTPYEFAKTLQKSLLPNLFSFSQILGKDHAVACYSYVDELPSLDAELYKVSYSRVHFGWNKVFSRF